MSIVGRMQWISEAKALKLVQGKPCKICGAPACCAVRDYGIAPACLAHGLMAQGLGYLVAFPEPIPMFNKIEELGAQEAEKRGEK